MNENRSTAFRITNIYVKILIYLGNRLLIAFFFTCFSSYYLACYLAHLSYLMEGPTPHFMAANLIPMFFTVLFVITFSLLTLPIAKKMIVLEKALLMFIGENLSYRIPHLGFRELDKVATTINSLMDHLQQETKKEFETQHFNSKLMEDIVSGLRPTLNSLIHDITLLKTSSYNNLDEYAKRIHEANTKAVYLKKRINELLRFARDVSSDAHS